MNEYSQIQQAKLVRKLGKRFFYSRRMRREPTMGENTLWQLLRSGIGPYRFRPQYVIGRYIADFYCGSGNLIVEVDGSSHLKKSAYDKRRDAYFRALGLRTLRLDDKIVREEPGKALERVRAALGM